MINEFNGMNQDLLENLLDTYQMKNWGMTWEEFILQAQKELNDYLQELSKERVGE